MSKYYKYAKSIVSSNNFRGIDDYLKKLKKGLNPLKNNKEKTPGTGPKVLKRESEKINNIKKIVNEIIDKIKSAVKPYKNDIINIKVFPRFLRQKTFNNINSFFVEFKYTRNFSNWHKNKSLGKEMKQMESKIYKIIKKYNLDENSLDLGVDKVLFALKF